MTQEKYKNILETLDILIQYELNTWPSNAVELAKYLGRKQD